MIGDLTVSLFANLHGYCLLKQRHCRELCLLLRTFETLLTETCKPIEAMHMQINDLTSAESVVFKTCFSHRVVVQFRIRGT